MNKQYEIPSKLARLAFLGVLYFLIFFDNYAQQVPKMTPGGRGYLEFLPAGYSTSTALYPCIIFLHGSGERGDGSPAQLTKVTAQGTPKFIKNGATMCFVVNGVNECFIVLSPQQTTNRWGWQGDVMPFVKFALTTYRIDPDRVYLTGLSMGGDGTWDTSYDPLNEPNYFAAMSPISCKGDFNKAKITANRKIAVWALHGDKDTSVPPSEGKRPINGMNTVAPNPVPIWTLVPGGTHGGSTWDKTYSPTHTYYNPNIYEWFLTFKRGAATPKPPLVNAGVDKSITLPVTSVSLAGTATDSDGTIVSTLWASSGVPAGIVASPSALSTNITGLTTVGIYVFSLSATDNSGLTTTDLVTVQVQPAPTPKPPTANAGIDKTITLPINTTTLTGSGSDPDGTISSYLWTLTNFPVGGGGALFGSASTASTSFNNLLIAGSYVLTLTVTDNSGLTSSDEAVVTVLAAPPNAPPVANAGQDKNITLPISSVALTGTGTDSDGSIASYEWIQSSGITLPPGSISPITSANTTITNLTEGVYTFTLKVTDNKGSTGVDQVIVTVFPEPPNAPPTANAGTDKSITLPINTTTLNGTGNDMDGTISTYLWTLASSPPLSNALIASPSTGTTAITNLLVEGSYVFTLTVTDNKGIQGSDQVVVLVLPVPPNQPPTANAGPDKNITLPISTVTVTGIGTDTDGTISSFSWTKQSGPSTPAPVIVTPTQTGTQINNLVVGVYTFEFTVTDNKGVKGSDLVVITVFPAANIPPTANAGGDKIITLPINSVSFTGNGIDTDGTIASFLWVKVSGPTQGDITAGSTTANATAGNLTSGIYTFSITVTDNNGAIATDQVGVTVLPEPPNQPPVANAGPDKNLTLPANSSTTLSGSGTDSDGTIVSYLWNFVSGPPQGTSSELDQPALDLSDLGEGIYVFELTVTDNRGATSTDEVKIFVDAINQPPNADAGIDKSITLPVNSVLLVGSGSDPDGTISSYVWEQISGPTPIAIFDTPLSAQVTASELTQGIYTFSLRVTDNDGVVDTDPVNVLVNPAPPNSPPIASVGPDLEITLPISSVSVTGSGTDSDGTIASYLWSQISGPSTATTAPAIPNQPAVTFSALTAGSYVFRLSITDNKGAVGQKDLKVKVNPQPVNVPPVANAGSDQQIVLPANLVTLTGSGTDSDGTIIQYQWEVINGPSTILPSDFSPAGGSTAVTQVQNLVEGIYVFRLVVTDNKGVSTFDEVAVTVKPIPFNLPPIANAGGNKVITLPMNLTTLTGSGSDSDGSITGYSWSLISAPASAPDPMPAITTQSNLSIGNLETGIYVFRLTVTDNKGSTGFDEMNVRVQPVPANQPPTADAGTNKIITLPNTTVTFNGGGTDPDGSIDTYLWTAISFPPSGSATLGVATDPTLSPSDLDEGTYIFRLTVTDNSGLQGFDEVNVRVNPDPPNTPPSVNAGVDVAITGPTNSIIITATAIDADGTIASSLWSQISGPNTASTTPTPPDQLAVTFGGLTTGSYVFRISVTDNEGSSAFDEVKVTVNPEPNNIPPVVNVGIDQFIILPNNVTLMGTATDSDGTISTTIWSQISGPIPQATITNSGSLTTSVSDLQIGTYVFGLSATDNNGSTGIDEVTINVSANLPPVAFAGTDVEIISPTTTAEIIGGGSDPDGSIIQYTWTQVSGNNVLPSQTDNSTLLLEGLTEGNSYLFRLTVSDNNGLSDSDEVQVDVRTVTINQLPTVEAGNNNAVLLPLNSIQLNGSAIDPDGAIEAFLWTQVSGPDEAEAATFSDPTVSDPVVSNLTEGTYVFRLTATDNSAATNFDELEIVVKPASTINILPVAVAGVDSTLTLPVNSIQLSGLGTDEDGTIVSFLWTQISGPTNPNVSISDATIPSPVITGMVEGVYIFELTVTDDSGESSSSQVRITLLSGDIENVVFPKVFSPNGDNNNDKWTWGNSTIFDGCELNIFNRFGKKVFGMTSYDNSWDGTANGVPLEAEAYYFVIKCGDGKQTTGGVRIVR